MFRRATKAPADPSAAKMAKKVNNQTNFKANARKIAELRAKADGKSDADIKKAGDDAEAEADIELRTMDNARLSKKLTNSEDAEAGPIGPQKPGNNKEQEALNTKQQNDAEAMMKTAKGAVIIAALGLTLAVTILFIVKAAEAAKACTDCRDFKITITSIKPTPGGIPVVGSLFGLIKPSTVDVAYTCPTNYEPLEGKESFTFKDTGFPEMDDMTFTVDKVLGKNKVQVKCGTDDCSDLKGTKGAINPNCADFNARFNKEVEKAAEAAGDAAKGLGKGLGKGLFQNMGTILFVVGVCVMLYFLTSAISRS